MTGFDGSEMDDQTEGAPGIGPAKPSGPFVIRLLAGSEFAISGPPCFLAGWDVEAHDGRGTADATHDPDQAHQFATGGEALAAWRTQSTVRPLRDDGKPNRPLSGFTIEVLTIDQARQEATA